MAYARRILIVGSEGSWLGKEMLMGERAASQTTITVLPHGQISGVKCLDREVYERVAPDVFKFTHKYQVEPGKVRKYKQQ